MAGQAVTIQITGDESDLKKVLQEAAKDLQKFGAGAEAAGKKTGADYGGGFTNGIRAGLRNFVSEFKDAQYAASSGFPAIADAFLAKVVNPITLGATAVGAAIIAAFQFSRIGEENEKISLTFQRFAKDSGLEADRLKEKISSIAEGFVDLEDVLPRAGQAVLALGKNAERLPEILALARNIGIQTGKDITEVFNELTTGIENQNVKLLRQNSIRLDAQKVLEDYAKTQQVSVNQLSEAAKQQAFLNAALEQGAKKFSDVNTQAAPMQGGIRKLALAFDDLKDSIAAIANSNLGSFFASIISGTANAVKTVAKSIDELSGKPKTLEEDIKKVQNTITRLNEMRLSNPGFTAQYDKQISEAQAKLQALKNVQDSVDKANQERDRASAERNKLTKTDIVAGETGAEATARLEKERQTLADIAAIQAEANAMELQAETDHQIALATIANDGIANTNSIRDMQTEAALQRNQLEFESAVAKNAKIEDANKLAAANVAALEKKKIADQKVTDAESIKTSQLTAEAKQKIEQNLFATAFTLAEGNAEATKALNIAQAIRNTYQGASLALATYPPPFGAIAAGSTIALGLAQVAKITGAANGALVETGVEGKDTNPFLLSKGEIVAPSKSFDEVVEGTARQRGYVKGGDSSNTDKLLEEIINKLDNRSVSVTVNTDVIADENGINTLVARIRDAIDFNAAPSLG